jgi:hypothetical protein
MTDEELLLHQLKNPPTMSMALNKDHLYRMMADHMKGAADRIDELEVSLQAVLNREAATTARYDAKTDELEAKLAECLERNALLEARLGKAVEALRDVHVFGVITHTALAVLAEIESSEAAPPYGLEGEKT